VLKHMMRGERQGVLMRSILLYTTKKFSQSHGLASSTATFNFRVSTLSSIATWLTPYPHGVWDRLDILEQVGWAKTIPGSGGEVGVVVHDQLHKHNLKCLEHSSDKTGSFMMWYREELVL